MGTCKARFQRITKLPPLFLRTEPSSDPPKFQFHTGHFRGSRSQACFYRSQKSLWSLHPPLVQVYTAEAVRGECLQYGCAIQPISSAISDSSGSLPVLSSAKSCKMVAHLNSSKLQTRFFPSRIQVINLLGGRHGSPPQNPSPK